MIRPSFLAAPLVLGLLSAHAFAGGKTPPPEYAAYVAAARKADAIADPLQRCLAYPDLPGNTWTPGLAKARCTIFLSPTPYSLDAIDRSLAHPGGAASLETGFRALLDAHFSDPTQRDRIFIAFMAFNDDDHDKAERIARAWVAAAPESAFARTALGRVLERRGWDARGTKLAKDTPDDNIRKMRAYFIDAGQEYMAAMQAEPRLFPACEGLMGIGRQSSGAVQAHATKQCIDASPASFYVVEELMTAAEPRWGGSTEQMRAVSAYAKAREQDNPMLALFAFDHALYQIEQLDDGDAQAIAVLEPASQQVPNAAYLRKVGGAYTRKNDNWKAVVYLSQALRFSPDYAQESRFRAIVLRELGETKWARADAERAAALDPKNGHALQLLGKIVRELDGPVAALPWFKRALEDSKTREYAFNDYCGSLTQAKQFEEASKCVDDLLAAYPENPEGWRERLLLIGFDAPQSLEAMERFVALNDPKRWDNHAAAADTVRKVLALKNGTTLSPSDLYDARMTRAQALEHLPSARPYQERIMAASSPLFEHTVGACRAELKRGIPGSFTAVVDAQANGTLGNVAIRPVNAWTSCIAKQFESKWKLPPPPSGFEIGGYPLLFELRMK